MYFENNSKCYAIGRIVNAGKTFILYLESAMNKNTGYGENQIFIVSLDNNYQPVESKSIGYYYETTSYDNESNTIYNITDIYASILSLPFSPINITSSFTLMLSLPTSNIILSIVTVPT